MKTVSAKDEVRAFDGAGQPVYRLERGLRYVLYDDEAARGAGEGALEILGECDSQIPPYRGEPLRDHRLLLPFIGKLGDAVATASCVAALTRRFPDATVTVAAPPPARRVFALFPDVLETRAYPASADDLDRYDYLMSFEEIEAVRGGSDMSLCEVLSRCLHTPRPESPAPLCIPAAALDRWPFENQSAPRVAIHAGPIGSLRSYPQHRTETLVSVLVDAGADVYLVGTDPTWTGRRSPSTWVHDLIHKTPAPADLAAVLSGMQVLVTCDSFPMHLAGAMGLRTVALLASTSPALARDYPSVTAMQSSASCCPCGVAEGSCPLGQPGCIAFHDQALDPNRIARAVLALCPSPAAT